MSMEPIKVGKLTKKGAVRKNWKLRVFKLFEDKLTYAASVKAKPKGEIPIEIMESVEKSSPPPIKKFSKQFAFKIATPGRVYECLSTEEAERDAWVEELSKMVGKRASGSVAIDLNTREKIVSLFRTCKTSALATFSGDSQQPRVRYVAATLKNDMEIRFSTFAGSQKAKDIKKNPLVHLTLGYTGLAFENAGPYAQIEAMAYISAHPKDKADYWNDGIKDYFSGPDDPNYVVVVALPYRIEYQARSGAEAEVWTSPIAESIKNKAMLYSFLQENPFGALTTFTGESTVKCRYTRGVVTTFDDIIFSIERDCEKYKEIIENSLVHYVCGYTGTPLDMKKSFVQIEGEVMITEAEAEKKQYWDDHMSSLFSGPDDPSYLIGVLRINAFEFVETPGKDAVSWNRRSDEEALIAMHKEEKKEVARRVSVSQQKEGKGAAEGEEGANPPPQVPAAGDGLDVKIAERGREDIIKDIMACAKENNSCAFATMSGKDKAVVRYVALLMKDECEIRFSAHIKSRKIGEIRNNGNVHITFGYTTRKMDPQLPYCQYAGLAEVSDKAADKKAFWTKSMKKSFKNAADPNYVVVIVKPKRIEYLAKSGAPAEVVAFGDELVKMELGKKLKEIVAAHPLCAASTLQLDGSPKVRYVMTKINDDLVVRFSTMKGSNKYKELLANPEIHIAGGYGGVAFENATSYFQIAGRGMITEDKAEKESYWSKYLEGIFIGPDDPNYVVCVVKPQKIEFVEKMGTPAQVIEFEEPETEEPEAEEVAAEVAAAESKAADSKADAGDEAAKRAELFEKVRNFVGEHNLGAAATVTEDGNVKVRYLMVETNEELELRFSTSKASEKYKELQKTGQIHITMGYTGVDIADASSYCQIEGKACVTDDAKERHAYWNKSLDGIFSGPDDENYVVCVVRPQRIEFVEKMGTPAKVLDFEVPKCVKEAEAPKEAPAETAPAEAPAEDLKSMVLKHVAENPLTAVATLCEGEDVTVKYVMMYANDELEFRFSTKKDSNKAKQLIANPEVHMTNGYSGKSFEKASSYIQIQGTAVVTEDQDEKNAFWSDQMLFKYTGPEDESLVIVIVKPTHIEFVEKMGTPAKVLEFEEPKCVKEAEAPKEAPAETAPAEAPAEDLKSMVLKHVAENPLTAVATLCEGEDVTVKYVMMYANDELEFRFSTKKDSNKAKQLIANPEVHMTNGYSGKSLEKASSYIQIQGTADVTEDQDEKNAFWSDQMLFKYTGPEDESLVIVIVKPTHIEFVEKMGTPAKVLDFEVPKSVKEEEVPEKVPEAEVAAEAPAEDLKSMVLKHVAENPLTAVATLCEGEDVTMKYVMMYANDELEFRFSTKKDSNKAKQLIANPEVHMMNGYSGKSLEKASSYIQIQGTAVVTEDQGEKNAFWSDQMLFKYTGPEDESLVIVIVKPYHIEFVKAMGEPKQVLDF